MVALQGFRNYRQSRLNDEQLYSGSHGDEVQNFGNWKWGIGKKVSYTSPIRESL
jgi:hypothetical protein